MARAAVARLVAFKGIGMAGEDTAVSMWAIPTIGGRSFWAMAFTEIGGAGGSKRATSIATDCWVRRRRAAVPDRGTAGDRTRPAQ